MVKYGSQRDVAVRTLPHDRKARVAQAPSEWNAAHSFCALGRARMIDTAGWFGGPTELSEVRADHGVGGASNGATLAQVTCVRG